MDNEGGGSRRRSSLASKKRITLHLQRFAGDYDVTPDQDDRRGRDTSSQKRSLAPTVASGTSVMGAVQVEEPVSRLST